MPPHPLTKFEIQRYYQKKSKFNGFYSSDNLLNEIKNRACLINIDEYANVGTHQIALYAEISSNVTYFDGFGVENIPKEIKSSIGNKNLLTNIFRIEVYNSIMWRYFCIGFVDHMLAGKTLINYTNLFLPEMDGKISYF